MSKTAKRYLIEELKFNKNKVHQIYHGAPKFKKLSSTDKEKIRTNLGFKNKDKIIYTYGILREDKGIREIINSLPRILQKEENAKLLITGSEQDSKKPYMKELKKIIKKKKLGKNVKFIEKFISQENIGKYLQISNLFITAQSNFGLHSSGTLSYALSAGLVIISTPTIHAIEVLKNRGSIIKNNNSLTISEAIVDILSDKAKYQRFKIKSEKFSKKIYWKNISKEYLTLFLKIIN
ncbi:MAG: glycosyltransferase [Parcubacteria group bacterium]|nr:glycosyltransferase [Parcubacteria group bacterium]